MGSELEPDSRKSVVVSGGGVHQTRQMGANTSPRISGSRPNHDNDDEVDDSDQTLSMAKLVKRDDGQFPGSFAGTLRTKKDCHLIPWYRRREYFTEGWLDASIWRAAVS